MSLVTPPVGWIVQFIPFADKAHSVPVAGVVVASSRDGQVKLNLLRTGGGEMISTGEYVRHIDDPWVRENSQSLMKSRNGVERGAWDWVPGMVYSLQPPNIKVDSVTYADVEKKILSLAAEGKSNDEIFKSVRRLGVSREDVNVILELSPV